MRLTLLFTVLASAVLAASAAPTGNECNGAVELCERPYNKVAFAMTHNSYAVGQETAANQNFDVTRQLNDGVRVVNLDAIPSGNGINLCHSDCNLLNGGPATDTLSKIAKWMGTNKREVVTIIWENSKNIPAATFAETYKAAGLDAFAYTKDPADSQEWPTLGAMIDNDKRLVNFLGSGADASVPWLHAEFSYVFETPFENYSPSNFSCVVGRPANGQNLGMYVLNHFLYDKVDLGDSSLMVPNRNAASTTNGKSLEQHAQMCSQTFQRVPNFVAVDFYEKGSQNVNIMSVVALLNQVEYVPKPLGDGNSDSTTNQVNNTQKNAAVTFRHPSFVQIARTLLLGAISVLTFM